MRNPLEVYTLKRTVDPTQTPVTLADVKAHMRVDDSDSDSHISGLLEAAADAVSEMAGKALVSQTWQIQLGQTSGQTAVYLPMAPIQSITSISYYDTDDASQSANTGDYVTKGDDDRAWIMPAGTGVWPAMYDRSDALTIVYVAGYGATAASVPGTLKQAIKMLTAHWYENREAGNFAAAEIREIPFGVREMINISRVGWMAG